MILLPTHLQQLPFSLLMQSELKMSSIMSTFQEDTWIKFDDQSEAGHEVESKPDKEKEPEYDLIAFLAVVQMMKVAILPITWQPAQEAIGKGGSGSINQASINSQTSLAFKRVSDGLKQKLKCASSEQEQKRLRADIFRALINEITVLSHPKLRNHQNIVELQGICWDVEDNEVWPVLVFEKAQFGDFENFLELPVARDLSSTEKLSLCIDVGIAFIDMHSQGKYDNMIPLPIGI